MKWLSFTLLLLCQKAFGQSYIPMLGNISQWHVVSCFNGCGIDSYSSSGDTLLDGQHYQVLDGYHYIQGNFLIREDVAARKVYMKVLAEHTLLGEFPLYDFSLEAGDTTHVYNPISPMPEDGGLFVLDSVISRPLVNGAHRFFYLHAVDPILSSSGSTVWVEGVGSLSLINSPGAAPTAQNHLGCQFRDGVLQYANTDSINSCIGLAIIDAENIGSTIRVTSIPDLDGCWTIFNSGKKSYSFKLFTLDGKLIEERFDISDDQFHLAAPSSTSSFLVLVITLENSSVLSFKLLNSFSGLK